MSTNDGHIPVLDVDQVFPVLTTDAANRPTSASAAEGDQSGTVAAALRTVLGWRPRAQDTHAFAAALRASFQLSEVEGHTVSRYVPRGVAVQADLGGVSGGQASLYSRARLAADQATTLLDSLTPLRVDYDPQDGEAFRTLVRHGVARLVEELGNLGGPRRAIVDGAFDVLLGPLPDADAVLAMAVQTPDTVPGQLGALRDRFGLVDENVNTVEEESLRTSFWTLVDLVLDLRRSWEAQRGGLESGSGSGFLGTDLVIVNRLLAAAAEQVDEVEAVLDSALVGAAERQTIVLGRNSGLTLDGLLSWVRRFLTEDGPLYLRDTGRDGIRTAFAPMAMQLITTVHRQLVDRIGALPQGQQPNPKRIATGAFAEGPVVYVPTGWAPRFPSGMYAARTRIAVSGLSRLLEELFATSARISRFPGIVLFDVEIQPFWQSNADSPNGLRVQIRGANFRPGFLPAFFLPRAAQQQGLLPSARPQAGLLLPVDGSATVDDDTLTAIFKATPLTDLLDVLHDGDFPVDGAVLLPAQSLPIAVLDGETGAVISAPPVRDWPTYLRAPRTADDRPFEWDTLDDDDRVGGPAYAAPRARPHGGGPARPGLRPADGWVDEGDAEPDDMRFADDEDEREDDERSAPHLPTARDGTRNGGDGERRGTGRGSGNAERDDRSSPATGQRRGATATLERQQTERQQTEPGQGDEQQETAEQREAPRKRTPAKRTGNRREPAEQPARPRRRSTRAAGTTPPGGGGDAGADAGATAPRGTSADETTEPGGPGTDRG